MSLSATNRLKPGSDSEGAPPGPGPQLRDARRARRLSVEEAARRMKLEASIIEALERDDYAEISAPLYVKGYLVGYARLLDLPEDDVLEGFRNSQAEGASPVISAERTLGRRARSVDRGVRWFSYGFGILILGIATYWGYEQWLEDRWVAGSPAASVESVDEVPATVPVNGTDDSAETPESAPALQEAMAAPEPPVETQPVAKTLRDDQNVQTEPPITDLGIGGPDPLAEGTGEPAAGSSASTGSEHDQAVPAVVAQPASGADGAALTSGGMIASTSPATVGDDVADRLEMAFNRDCWIEIRDSTDTRLAYGLVKSGSVRRYEGQAPFRITVGDSAGVSILFNGHLVDPASYGAADGEPARLTLESQEPPA